MVYIYGLITSHIIRIAQCITAKHNTCNVSLATVITNPTAYSTLGTVSLCSPFLPLNGCLPPELDGVRLSVRDAEITHLVCVVCVCVVCVCSGG